MAQFNQGVYVCRVTKQGFDESKEKKTPYFWLEFQALGQVNPDDPEGPLFGCDEWLRNVSLWLTEKTADRTRDKLIALGWNGERWQDLEPGGAHSFEGVELRLQCTHEQTDDKVYEKWDFPFDGPKEQKHTTGIARSVDALFGRAKKPASQPPTQPRPKPAAQSAARPEPAMATEDIPF